ncbi:MAG TPA: amino acid ABC transporter permease [Actinokineospora sp.]|jgi:polar amino acid transport system permease protein|nr:amino acid ABC transporter permease [Actinokineospora sp.]
MDALTTILNGVPATLGLTLAALALGAALGVPLVVLRRSGNRLVAGFARLFIELLRGIPPIVWLFIIYFGVGTTVKLSSWTAATVGLGLISAAYMAEIYRGGLNAMHAGQWDAAHALGLSRTAIITRVIGPQLVRVSIPASASFAIGLLKDSSVAYTIGIPEITSAAREVSQNSVDAMVPFLLAAGVYVAITIPCAWAARRLDTVLRSRVAR